MAVQAQYPSSFLDAKQGDSSPGNDYPWQPSESGREFIDNTAMFFHGTNNPRKRSRYPQPFSSEFDTGLHLSSGSPKQLRSSQSVNSLSIMGQNLSHHIKQQRNELQNLLQAQGEELRRTLGEKTKRHYGALLRAAEDSAVQRLGEREAELEKAAQLNSDLEARVAQLNAEVQTWQARAREQEVTAAMLQAQLQQAMKCSAHQVQIDAGNELGCTVGDEDDAESQYIDPDRVVELTGPSCKRCLRRDASVVVLPCRHFCLCRVCDSVAQLCPICYSYRSSSVEALLS
ncbi:probable BOI-related E3 ubiquitin-protein ligase 2 [Olea europaea var. sylvestris]|uniref:probable BOI-related E3 ubiquitin-protein ligase 2 n=1 Tax=Olea europaea var. sylvestris TaxID=158386 RepID=UPI000C1D1244|nr:probable BOI-related E3 ubiquitin-protein ligase 2 [Olea europaea var. sylvestris]